MGLSLQRTLIRRYAPPSPASGRRDSPPTRQYFHVDEARAAPPLPRERAGVRVARNIDYEFPPIEPRY
jgi:hypothetical protein